MRRNVSNRNNFLLSLLLVLAFATSAGAQPEPESDTEEGDDAAVQACAAAYEQAQVTRNDGQLVQAQQHVLACVQDVCPDFVKVDCGRWLSEIKREIPSVIFAVRDSRGADITTAKVVLDGTEISHALDGTPRELNPGSHDLVIEYAGKQVRQSLTIRQAEKNRVVSVQFETLSDRDEDGVFDEDDLCPEEPGIKAEKGCLPPHQAGTAQPAGSSKALRTGAFVALGVGAAGLLVGGGFGLKGYLEQQTALEKCLNEDDEQTCTDEEGINYTNEVELKYTIANVAFGVGIAGAVVGGILFYLSLDDQEASPQSASNSFDVSVVPTDSGGYVNLSGQF